MPVWVVALHILVGLVVFFAIGALVEISPAKQTLGNTWMSVEGPSGLPSTGNLVRVVHTWVDIDPDRAEVRVISARRPNRREARQYREESTR
jgi:hypothetical protein